MTGFEYPEVSFVEKKKKAQDFYDNWAKPMKRFMSPKMLLDIKDFIKEYSLVE